jgi:hypothetical protein
MFSCWVLWLNCTAPWTTWPPVGKAVGAGWAQAGLAQAKVTKAKVVLRAPQKPLPQTAPEVLGVLGVLGVLCTGALAPVALPWLLAVSATAIKHPWIFE